MGRPQESFHKKENEQKKAKKKEEKERKKEERKASGGKKGLDEMMAYLDEDGNITSTPPDPLKKKKEIKQEDIQISVSRQSDLEPTETIRKGTVSFFNTTKGFGFIKDHETQESIFVHVNALSSPIKENDKVTFEVEPGPKGPMAVRVKLV